MLYVCKMNYFNYLYIIILLSGCAKQAVKVSHVQTTSYPAHISNATTNERIYFINFGCKKIGDTDSCFVINTLDADGKLNGAVNEHPHDSPGNNYICKVYDCNDKLIYEEEITNPLQHRVDLFSQDGQIESKELKLQEAEFSIRFQQAADKACAVVVEKQTGSKNIILCKSNIK